MSDDRYTIRRPQPGRPSDKRVDGTYLNARPKLAGIAPFDPATDVDLIDEVERVVGNVRADVAYADPELGADLHELKGNLEQSLADSAQSQALNLSLIGAKGRVVTSAALPAGAADGDAYMVESTGTLWRRNAGAWADTGFGVVTPTTLPILSNRFVADDATDKLAGTPDGTRGLRINADGNLERTQRVGGTTVITQVLASVSSVIPRSLTGRMTTGARFVSDAVKALFPHTITYTEQIPETPTTTGRTHYAVNWVVGPGGNYDSDGTRTGSTAGKTNYRVFTARMSTQHKGDIHPLYSAVNHFGLGDAAVWAFDVSAYGGKENGVTNQWACVGEIHINENRRVWSATVVNTLAEVIKWGSATEEDKVGIERFVIRTDDAPLATGTARVTLTSTTCTLLTGVPDAGWVGKFIKFTEDDAVLNGVGASSWYCISAIDAAAKTVTLSNGWNAAHTERVPMGYAGLGTLVDSSTNEKEGYTSDAAPANYVVRDGAEIWDVDPDAKTLTLDRVTGWPVGATITCPPSFNTKQTGIYIYSTTDQPNNSVSSKTLGLLNLVHNGLYRGGSVLSANGGQGGFYALAKLYGRWTNILDAATATVTGHVVNLALEQTINLGRTNNRDTIISAGPGKPNTNLGNPGSIRVRTDAATGVPYLYTTTPKIALFNLVPCLDADQTVTAGQAIQLFQTGIRIHKRITAAGAVTLANPPLPDGAEIGTEVTIVINGGPVTFPYSLAKFRTKSKADFVATDTSTPTFRWYANGAGTVGFWHEV